MDPISIVGLVASSIAIIQAADRIGGLLGKLKPLFEAPREVDQLIKDVKSLKSLINNLSEAAKEMDRSNILPTGKMETLKGFVDEAGDILTELDGLIELLKKPSKGIEGKHKVHRGTWTRKVGEVENLRNRMRELRLSVAVELSTLHLFAVVRSNQSLDRITFQAGQLLSEHISTQRFLLQEFPEHRNMLSRLLGNQEAAPIYKPHCMESTEPTALEVVDSGHADPVETLRNLRQKIESRYSCDQWCRCICHVPYRVGIMTRWAGSLSVRIQGMPYTGNSCNVQSCNKRSSMRIQVQLSLPSWILSRILMVSILCHSYTIPQFNFRTLRVRHDGEAIFVYARIGNLDGIKKLFTERKASVFDVDTDNCSALTVAVTFGHYTVVKFLLDQGSDQYLEDRARRSPYVIALETLFFTECVKTQTMIRQLFFRDTENDRSLPQMSNLQLLISNKMCGDVHKEIQLSRNDIDYKDLTGNTALHWAVLYGKTDVVQTLLSNGADPMCFNSADSTPLHIAAMWDHKSIPLLLEAGADPDIRNYHGESPLHRAALKRHWEPGLYISPLLDAGANINAQTKRGATPLNFACGEYGNFVAVAYLIQQGADINLPFHEGNTPIAIAIQWQNSSYVQLLMEAGAECCGVNIFGENILHQVAMWGDIETIQVLNKWWRRLRGVDVFLKNKWGNTPLDYAMSREDISGEWAELFGQLVSAILEFRDQASEPSEDMNDAEWITTDDDGTSEDEYSDDEDAQSSVDDFQNFEDALEVQDELEEL